MGHAQPPPPPELRTGRERIKKMMTSLTEVDNENILKIKCASLLAVIGM